MSKVINGGPYFINGKLIILRRWSRKMILDRDILTTIPIWIRLPELNLRLWDKETFGAIASVVEPHSNSMNKQPTKRDSARILIEIKADAKLPNEVYITMHDGENLIQQIEYE